ncbi:MAG: translation initiation factor [Planctomycetes bacterium]|nr:translation initiation factor [Planctomycetota bacterium]
MSGLFSGTPLERPVTCAVCEQPLDACTCPRDAGGHVLRPKDQTAVIRRERRRRGKTVTTVTGLDPTASDLAAIARDLKGRCASGGTVSDGVIEVQGDHGETVAEVLRTMGYRVRP